MRRLVHSNASHSESALRTSLNPKLATASPPLTDRVKSKLGADSSFSVVTIQQCQSGSDFNESTRRSAALRLIVKGLAAKLLPLRVCPVNGDRARFAIRRNRDPAIPADLSILHRGDVVSSVVYHSVGDG